MTSIAPLLDAWSALCVAAGHEALTAAEALTAGTPDHRAAVWSALADLGYPSARESAYRLGSALRRLRSLTCSGRRLSPSRGRITRWYVRTIPVGSDAEPFEDWASALDARLLEPVGAAS